MKHPRPFRKASGKSEPRASSIEHRGAPPRAKEDPTQIYGLHPVEELLRAGRRSCRTIWVARGEDAALANLLALARERGVSVQTTHRDALDKKFPNAVHQGIAAEAGHFPMVNLEDLADDAVITVLDGIEDPHNFGAIVRAGVALGASGFVIGGRRSAPLSATAFKASAGALEHARIVRAGGIPQALHNLKQAGRWIAGLAMDGTTPISKLNGYRPLALVVGAEGDGLHRLAGERCDLTVSIPMNGPLDSLNAATAAAIVLYAALRSG